MTDSTTIASQIGPAIDVLATKLKVPSQFIWEILVRQAAVEFWTDLAITLVFGAAFALFLVPFLRGLKRSQDGEDVSDSAMGWLVAGGLITGVIFVLSITVTLGDISGMMNPEYYALNKILEVVK